MILKAYQKRTLATVRNFLEGLATWRDKDRAARSQDPEWGFDWVERAWSRTVAGRPYHPRLNGLGERLPAFCLKIPTGGGKTLVATRVIDLADEKGTVPFLPLHSSSSKGSVSHHSRQVIFEEVPPWQSQERMTVTFSV